MKGFYIILTGYTASFREPSSHLYQRTFPLPPISAMAGLAGAALGEEFSNAWNYFKKNNICVGVRGMGKGRAIDLWGYNKMVVPKNPDEKTGTSSLNLDKALRRDILNREFIAYPCYNVYYCCENSDVINNLHAAFKNTAYALSLGGSDDIAMLKYISDIKSISAKDTVYFDNTLVPGDVSNNIFFDWEMIKKSSVSHTIVAPLVGNLIVDFDFTNGIRKSKIYKEFTFLSGNQVLKSSVSAYFWDDVAVPMYNIGGADK